MRLRGRADRRDLRGFRRRLAMDRQKESWRKASYSNGSGDCVEVGSGTGVVAVRDTKDREGVTLTLSVDAWREFTTSLK